RLYWVALAALAFMLLTILFFTIGPPGLVSPHTEKHVLLAFLALALTTTYGAVCGALTLAGEREDGTQTFLDTLPGSRGGRWGTVLAGRALLGPAALAASRRVYCRTQQSGVPAGDVRGGRRPLLWLTWRQGRAVILGSAVAAVLLAVALAYSNLPCWPVLT